MANQEQPISGARDYMPPIRASNFALLLGGIVAICMIAVGGGVWASAIHNETARTVIITSIFGFCTMIAHNTFSAFKLANQSAEQNTKTRHDLKSDMNAVSLQTQETAVHVKEVKDEVHQLRNFHNGRLQVALHAANSAVEDEGRNMLLDNEGIKRLQATWAKTMQEHLARTHVETGEGI